MSNKPFTYSLYLKGVKQGLAALPKTSNSIDVCSKISDCKHCIYEINKYECQRTLPTFMDVCKQHYQRALTQNPEILI